MFQSENVYDLHINASPCQFSIYDTNGDWEITKDEMFSLYPNDIADKLFHDLDKSGNKQCHGLISIVSFLEAYA